MFAAPPTPARSRSCSRRSKAPPKGRAARAAALFFPVMRVHSLSDLHLEQDSFSPPAVDADLVVLAGDVARGTRGVRLGAPLGHAADRSRMWPATTSSTGTPLPGPHQRAAPSGSGVARAPARKRRAGRGRGALARLHPVERLRLRGGAQAPRGLDGAVRAARQRLRAHHLRPRQPKAATTRHSRAAPVQPPLAGDAAGRPPMPGPPWSSPITPRSSAVGRRTRGCGRSRVRLRVT